MRLRWTVATALGLATTQARPHVSSPTGVYIGNSSISGLDQFLGIRYAEPPVGNLRFANPLPYQSNASATYDATAYGPGCSQLKIFEEYNGLSEDCLTLNIIRPVNTSSKAALPVMFWIYGGGNFNGQAIFYNGTALVQHSIKVGQPVIYVAVNYRLGGLGYPTGTIFKDAGVSNLGLKDQYLGLQWAHDNIASFGGDPDKVTIFGESAGAANCWSQLHYAYVRNETNKYFRGMITESGAPGSPAFPLVVHAAEGNVYVSRLLEKTNCSNAADSLTCLRRAPTDTIVPILVNGTIAEYTLDEDWFSAASYDLVETGQFARIPIIHGSNLNEGAVFMPSLFNPQSRSKLVETVAATLKNQNDSSTAKKIIDTYDKLPSVDLGKGVKADPSATREFFVECALYTDMWMDLGKFTLLGEASKYSSAWGYSFRQYPPYSALNLSYEYPGSSVAYAKRIGVYHGSELPYVFGQATSVDGHTQGDDEVSVAMMNAWISFAYYLDPNHSTDSKAISWPAYQSSGSSDRQLIVFEEQDGQHIRIGAFSQRPSVDYAWGQAFKVELGENPPF